jgi:hypothetical protein
MITKEPCIVLLLLCCIVNADKLRLLPSSGCFAHTDCPANSYCDYQTSPYSCAPAACVHAGDCPGSTCTAGRCIVPGINDGGSTNNNTDGPCRSNFDCAVTYKCNFFNLTCEPQPINCSSDSDCGQGYYCDFSSNSTCQPLADGDCFNDGDCTPPEYCYRRAHGRWGFCEFRCASHSDCGINEHCYYDPFFYSCVANDCNHDGDCYGNSTCMFSRCTT